MKLKRKIAATALALSLVAGVALATTPTDTPPPPPVPGPGYGMMGGQGMGPHHGKKMRGNAMMGPGMMGGQGMGCGMMQAGGPGMGRMMMQGGGCGMRGGAMMNPQMLEKRNQFLDATTELRKQIHTKQFAYIEASRNPKITLGELQAQQKELYTLRQELMAKRQAAFAAPVPAPAPAE